MMSLNSLSFGQSVADLDAIAQPLIVNGKDCAIAVIGPATQDSRRIRPRRGRRN